MDEETIKAHIDHIKNALNMPEKEGGMAAAQHGLELLAAFLTAQQRIAVALEKIAGHQEARETLAHAAISLRKDR